MTDTPEVKAVENAAHTLVGEALKEVGKLVHFTEDEVKALYEKLKGKL